MRASASAPGTIGVIVGLVLVLRAAGRVFDTSDPFVSANATAVATAIVLTQTANAIQATLRQRVLSGSHCVFKLGGQGVFTQPFAGPNFGTIVPPDDN
jgi:hypothetical protein